MNSTQTSTSKMDSNMIQILIDEEETQRWYLNGKLHRADGPAEIHPDGYQAWCINGKRHRTDGPAVIYQDGTQHWYQNGQLHRTDGPVIILPDGTQEWWINDEKINNRKITINQMKFNIKDGF